MTRLAQRQRPAPPLVQRKAAQGAARPVAAPRLDGGRPLEGPVRSQMESGFGRDFSQVRVHDGPAAAEAARGADALAYTVGNDVVFGAGQYRPASSAGAALLAHELAHTVQQGGQPVRAQHKAIAPPPAGSGDRLESEADRAADAVLAGRPVPALTRVTAPMLMRTAKGGAAAKTKIPPGPVTMGMGQASLPTTMTKISEDPVGPIATKVVVGYRSFTLPLPKGQGPWVNAAYKNAGNAKSAEGGRLVFTTNNANEGLPPAWKEDGSSGEYQRVWLNNLGFTSMKELGTAIKTSKHVDVVKAMTDPGVAAAVTGMENDGLQGSGFDIDHIVEKQIGGTSIPTNLQLLPSKKNQDSGTQTYAAVVTLVKQVSAAYPTAKTVQIRFDEVKVPPDPDNDAGFKIETFLRKGVVAGSKDVKIDASKTPVLLTAGGMGETVRVHPTEEVSITTGARRVVPGMRLKKYTRDKVKKGGVTVRDKVKAKLDSSAAQETAETGDVTLVAEISADAAKATEVGGIAKTENDKAATSGEIRKLSFLDKTSKLKFYYPYMSPGVLTSYNLADDGSISGDGYITPTLKFLPRVNIRFGKELLEATADLDAKKFQPPVPGIRFTEGMLKLVLADASGPKLQPSGQLKFKIGPAAKPLIDGVFDATVKDNGLAATGKLTPAESIPGIKDASGEFSYDQTAGWAGKLTATSAKIPNSVANVTLSFAEEGGKFVTKAAGFIETTIRGDKKIRLTAEWGQNGLIYTGELDWPKPFPIVDNVHLKGTYAADLLHIKGDAKFKFKQWEGDLHVHYRQQGQEAGKLSGDGHVDVETRNKKAKGKLGVAVDDAGELTGEGSLSYKLTDKITPMLGVKLTKGGHLTVLGEVAVDDFEVFRKWPDKGGERSLISTSASFKLPMPPLPVNAVVNIKAGVGVSYGIGPGKVAGLKLSGQFDPLEENPNVKAKLVGRFVIPTFFDLTGSLSARLGVEVAGGAIGIDGGVTVKPSIGMSADATVAIDANYEKGAFDFTGKAFIDVTPRAKLGIDLTASIYGLWHALEYEMTYPVKEYHYTFPSKLKINIGEIGYSSAPEPVGGIRWPKLSDISLEPKDLSPLTMMQDVMGKAKAKEKGK